jgi:hypothetical protein
VDQEGLEKKIIKELLEMCKAQILKKVRSMVIFYSEYARASTKHDMLVVELINSDRRDMMRWKRALGVIVVSFTRLGCPRHGKGCFIPQSTSNHSKILRSTQRYHWIIVAC